MAYWFTQQHMPGMLPKTASSKKSYGKLKILSTQSMLFYGLRSILQQHLRLSAEGMKFSRVSSGNYASTTNLVTRHSRHVFFKRGIRKMGNIFNTGKIAQRADRTVCGMP